MVWMERAEPMREWGLDVSAIAAAFTAGLNGRARQLGIEADEPGDYHILEQWRR